MLIPVRCFTCGKVLADKYRAYEAKAHAQALEEAAPQGAPTPKKTEADAAAAAFFEGTRTGKVLDELGLQRYCCRRHMVAHVEMMPII